MTFDEGCKTSFKKDTDYIQDVLALANIGLGIT